MSTFLRAALCALLLAGCIYLPVKESPLNRFQAERIVRLAYNGETKDSAGEVNALAYFLDVIDTRYYRKVDMLKLADSAVEALKQTKIQQPKMRLQEARKAMLASLDRHSVFFTHEEFTDFQRSLSGEFVGIGVLLKAHEQGAIIMEPLPNSPATEVGLQKGDIIIRGGKKSFKSLNLQQIVESLSGKVGTNVTLEILRGYGTAKQQNLVFSLRRAVVERILVDAKTLEDVGYIRLLSFSDETDAELEEVLENFEDQDLRGYIIDLRSNAGGYFQQAITIADYFLDEGLIVSSRSRDKEDTFSASSYRSITTRPVVILIDGATASSSEILALALSDHRRATIIGERSFGKGTVQTLYGLHNEDGLKLTTARYASPKGTVLIDQGIAPDIVAIDDLTTTEDEVIQAALLKITALSARF